MIRPVQVVTGLFGLVLLVGCHSDLTTSPESAPPPQVIRYGDDPNNQAILRMPSGTTGPVPVAVLIHGGFWAEPWDTALMSAIAEDLTASGLATWNVEFRRVGGRGGWPQTGDDVHDAVQHLAALADDHPIDLDRVVLVGHSSGGHLGLWAFEEAARLDGPVRPHHVIGLAAITDLDEFPNQTTQLIGDSRAAEPDAWDDAQPLISAAHTTLIFGAEDTTVSVATASNAASRGAEMVVIDGLGHLGIIEPINEAWPGIRSIIVEAARQ